MPNRSFTATAGFPFTHRFVAEIPPYQELEQRTLYICIEYATTIHLCACGCGFEVVNALSPTGWQMSFNGETASLSPSINNSSLACASHYWIDHGRIFWGETVTAARVEALRAADRRAKQHFYNETVRDHRPETRPAPDQDKLVNRLSRIWRRWHHR
ncbi:DUF6527 family protein [Mycolicibacterium chlorophenolicum]|uniref:Uncharacterized protein n=1 Tax=Mycolicibacterium chlorophenolicum TaxID=37916 RepID=A0A0J6VNQ0_9MYCO|nr:DUF6527 family protein [Mycolicibacterium chlorophenolicum]KMO71127.1 hypothetical protein MCHLDSM_04762 [Mycolicibacterium chlorophenolicum]